MKSVKLSPTGDQRDWWGNTGSWQGQIGVVSASRVSLSLSPDPSCERRRGVGTYVLGLVKTKAAAAAGCQSIEACVLTFVGVSLA